MRDRDAAPATGSVADFPIADIDRLAVAPSALDLLLEPDDRAVRHNRAAHARLTWRRLPERHRTVLAASLCGTPQIEIGRRLGISQPAVSERLSRAREAFRQRFLLPPADRVRRDLERISDELDHEVLRLAIDGLERPEIASRLALPLDQVLRHLRAAILVLMRLGRGEYGAVL